QKTAKTQPFPIGDAIVPQCAEPMPASGYEKAGCIFEAFWEEPVLIQPSGIGGTNWAPMSYNPETGSFYVSGTIRTSAFARYGDTYKLGQRYTGGTQAQLSANGDAVWVFSLKGQLGPLWPPPAPQSIAGPTGPIADGVNTIKIGDNNVEYSYGPARTRLKAGAAVTFTNVGDVQH